MIVCRDWYVWSSSEWGSRASSTAEVVWSCFITTLLIRVRNDAASHLHEGNDVLLRQWRVPIQVMRGRCRLEFGVIALSDHECTCARQKLGTRLPALVRSGQAQSGREWQKDDRGQVEVKMLKKRNRDSYKSICG